MINLKPTPTNIVIVLAIVIAIVSGAPTAFIWSLNTLFPALAIPYTLETWLAAFIISAAFKATVRSKGN